MQEFISVPSVEHALRTKLPFIAIASIVVAAGVCSLLLARLRSRERLFIWVGLFSILYGLRLFLQNDLLARALGVNEASLQPWTTCLTYVIPIPFSLFAIGLYGSGWMRSIKIWLWIQIAFPFIAIPFALQSRYWHWADTLNSVLVMGGTLVLLLHVLFRRQGVAPFAKGLTWPLLIFGVLVVVINTSSFRYGADVEALGFLVLLGGLGLTAARLAVERERKLVEVEQELTTARRIQNSIIPHSPPDFPRLQVATRYEPMTSVAGDFFDFLKTGEASLTILIADVSGHGVPAALVASMLKVSFAAQLHQAKNPAHVLAGLNTMLQGSLGGQYVTAACAAIDLHAQTITYAGAGHPPALLLRRSAAEVVKLDENGLFLGPFPHATYSNISVLFETGDKLLLYTDGITEATGITGLEFGQDNLERLLLDTAHLQPALFVDELFKKIATPAQQDDLTVIMAQFHANGLSTTAQLHPHPPRLSL